MFGFFKKPIQSEEYRDILTKLVKITAEMEGLRIKFDNLSLDFTFLKKKMMSAGNKKEMADILASSTEKDINEDGFNWLRRNKERLGL